MDEKGFTELLHPIPVSAALHLENSAIAFDCMDWRHRRELFHAGHAIFDELKNLNVCTKTNEGKGAFYRFRHELVFVFEKGRVPHINNSGLGDSDRYGTNVWD
jgi:hypothetical protein